MPFLVNFILEFQLFLSKLLETINKINKDILSINYWSYINKSPVVIKMKKKLFYSTLIDIKYSFND